MNKTIPVLALVALGAASPVGAAADWDYAVTPYLWASGLDGTQGIAGRTVELDAGFGDLVEFLDIGFAAPGASRLSCPCPRLRGSISSSKISVLL